MVRIAVPMAPSISYDPARAAYEWGDTLLGKCQWENHLIIVTFTIQANISSVSSLKLWPNSWSLLCVYIKLFNVFFIHVIASKHCLSWTPLYHQVIATSVSLYTLICLSYPGVQQWELLSMFIPITWNVLWTTWTLDKLLTLLWYPKIPWSSLVPRPSRPSVCRLQY